MQHSDVDAEMGDGCGEHGRAALRGMCARDEDDERAPDRVEGFEASDAPRDPERVCSGQDDGRAQPDFRDLRERELVSGRNSSYGPASREVP